MDLNKNALVNVLAVIIHDFSGPLNMAYMSAKFSEMSLKEGDGAEVVGDAISDTLQSLDVSIGLLEEVKEIARGKKLSKKEVNLSGLFSAIDAFIPKNGCELFVDWPDQVSVSVESSFYSLYIIIHNLVKNAYEHNPGCTVRLSFKDNVIIVEDTGKGMTEDQVSLIFSEYSTKADGGLGLQIVSSFAERLNATVEVESEVGKGSCFKLRLALKVREMSFIEKSSEIDEKSYIDLIIELKGSRPEWVENLSDRTAFSLLREGFNSVEDVRFAVANGMEINLIPNLARDQVQEVNELLSEPIR